MEVKRKLLRPPTWFALPNQVNSLFYSSFILFVSIGQVFVSWSCTAVGLLGHHLETVVEWRKKELDAAANRSARTWSDCQMIAREKRSCFMDASAFLYRSLEDWEEQQVGAWRQVKEEAGQRWPLWLFGSEMSRIHHPRENGLSL